jgi:hypothetical protein
MKVAMRVPSHRSPFAHGLSAAALLLVTECGSVTRPQVDTSCIVPSDIELKPIRHFETDALLCAGDEGGTVTWFADGDDTGLFQPKPRQPPIDCDAGPDAAAVNPPLPRVAGITATACVRTIGDQVCPTPGGTHNNALVLESRGHTEWGTVFGDFGLQGSPNTFVTWDAAVGTGYEGIAIIAKSPGNHDKAVTLLLDDAQTRPLTLSETAEFDRACGLDAGCVAVDAGSDAGEAGPRACRKECRVYPSDPNNIATVDQAGNILATGSVPPPDACGNQFRRILTVTENWQLHLLPFNTFVQDRFPNASPTGIDPSEIRWITIRAAKEANLELWIDEIAFYRRTSPGTSPPDASE